MDFNQNSEAQMKKIRKFGKRSGIISGILIFLIVTIMLGIQWVTEYIWMDSVE